MLYASTSGTGTVNLNGGMLIANATTASLATGTSVFNFNGGTLQAAIGTTKGAELHGGALAPPTCRPAARSSTATANNVTIGQPLLAPTANGLTGITLSRQRRGYIGPPVVAISGGGGIGATAAAQVDLNPASPTYGQLLGITVTSPGSGYTSNPSVTLIGGGATTAATTGSVSIAPVSSGGLTKLGGGTLTLSARTPTRATTIEQGVLVVNNIGTLGSGPVNLAGGTLRLNGQLAHTVAGLSG